MKSELYRFAYLFAPAVAVLVIAVLLAFVMGGPIAAAIAGFVFGSALIPNLIFIFLLLGFSSTQNSVYLLLMGTGAYLASILVVLVLWSMFGQSQIM